MNKALFVIALFIVNYTFSQDITAPSLKSGSHLKVSQNVLLNNLVGAASSYDDVKIETSGDVELLNNIVNLKKVSINCNRFIVNGAGATTLNLDGVTINCEILVFNPNVSVLNIRNKVVVTCKSIELQPSVMPNITIVNTGAVAASGVLTIEYDVIYPNGRTLTINDQGGFKAAIGKR